MEPVRWGRDYREIGAQLKQGKFRNSASCDIHENCDVVCCQGSKFIWLILAIRCMTYWRRAKAKCLHGTLSCACTLNFPIHIKLITNRWVMTLIWIVFLGYFRFEISDNGRSEGSEDTLPNETTVKFISEVSSKVCLPFRVAFVCPVVYLDYPMNQSKLDQNACSRPKRGKHVRVSRDWF